MIPLTFDGMMGKLHLPKGRPSGLGVVIVSPHGLEALAATKSLRLLAEALAAAGHAALRFDLPGTADSLGSDADPDRLEAWIAGTAKAAEVLKSHAGVGAVAITGLRFGAHIAALAAARIEGLAGLILLDPVVRGRLYARELTVTARAVAEGARLDPDATATPTGLVIGGLLTTTATLEAIKASDLGKIAPPSAPVLILQRKAASDATALAAAWSTATVTREETSGLEGIALSPTMAATPHLAFARAIAWMNGLASRPPQPVTALSPAVLETPVFVEEAFTFGPDQRLFGVLTKPAALPAAAPTLLIVNAGRNSHVGWARSGVMLARQLAAEGVASFRMDLGGVGDAADRPDAEDTVESVLYHPGSEPEVTAAIDALQARGHGATVMLGACSGAYLALRRAAADQRVQGVILVNIQRFVWREGETVMEAIASAYPLASSYVGKVLEPRAWKRLLSGERKAGPLLRELIRRLSSRVRHVLLPTAETRQARDLMDRLDARGVPVELVFSEYDAGLEDLARHFGPLGARLKHMPRVRLTLVPEADHDLTPEAARDVLFARTLAATKGLQEGA
jgi:alpha-beta hydrolase superfamily lysophospholipase